MKKGPFACKLLKCTPAVALGESFGFEIVGRLPRAFHHPLIDVGSRDVPLSLAGSLLRSACWPASTKLCERKETQTPSHSPRAPLSRLKPRMEQLELVVSLREGKQGAGQHYQAAQWVLVTIHRLKTNRFTVFCHAITMSIKKIKNCTPRISRVVPLLLYQRVFFC